MNVRQEPADVFNWYREAVVFESHHPDGILEPLSFKRIVVEPGQWGTLPHGYYTAKFECGWKGEIPMYLCLGRNRSDERRREPTRGERTAARKNPAIQHRCTAERAFVGGLFRGKA